MSLNTLKDVMSPLIIAFGVFCMYRGRRFNLGIGGSTGESGVVEDGTATIGADGAETGRNGSYSWSWTFWFGKGLCR